MTKIMEYMALGKASVQFDLTEGRRSAGSACLYAVSNDERDFAESILQVLGDPEARAAMGREGCERMAGELEWRYQAPRLLEAYRRALGGSPGDWRFRETIWEPMAASLKGLARRLATSSR